MKEDDVESLSTSATNNRQAAWTMDKENRQLTMREKLEIWKQEQKTQKNSVLALIKESNLSKQADASVSDHINVSSCQHSQLNELIL
jgi:hypothetical protein